jgi:hypothetical protein
LPRDHAARRLLREGFEGKHGVGFLDSFNRAHAIGDQCGNIIVGFRAHYCNQIINSGDRVNFRNFRHARQILCDLGYFVALDI